MSDTLPISPACGGGRPGSRGALIGRHAGIGGVRSRSSRLGQREARREQFRGAFGCAETPLARVGPDTEDEIGIEAGEMQGGHLLRLDIEHSHGGTSALLDDAIQSSPFSAEPSQPLGCGVRVGGRRPATRFADAICRPRVALALLDTVGGRHLLTLRDDAGALGGLRDGDSQHVDTHRRVDGRGHSADDVSRLALVSRVLPIESVHPVAAAHDVLCSLPFRAGVDSQERPSIERVYSALSEHASEIDTPRKKKCKSVQDARKH